METAAVAAATSGFVAATAATEEADVKVEAASRRFILNKCFFEAAGRRFYDFRIGG
jgi:hypothetical protein